MSIATLIAAEQLESGAISEACDRLSSAGLDPAEIIWMELGRVADIGFSGDIATARDALQPMEAQFDIAVQSGEHRRKMLLVSDMDSTMITVECIDELADYAGIKSEIAAITDQMKKALGGGNSGLNATLKFDFEGKGKIFIDGKATPNTVSNDDNPADCTITVALDTFKKMVARELDGTTAFMQGKLKVAGDMSVAMKLGPILAKAG